MGAAFVLSGGGSLGAVQVGMLQALAARGIQPDFLVGTSAGALNAVYVAGHGMSEFTLQRLEVLWGDVRRKTIFPLRPARLGAAAAGLAPSLCSDHGLRKLVADNVTFDRLEDAAIPVHVVATDVTSGKEVLLSHGGALDAVLASAAIPAVFPAVPIDGRYLVDGGIADNAAVSQAAMLGADVIYVLPTGYACALDAPPITALSSATHALTLLIEQRLIWEVAQFADHTDIRVLPPLCPLSISSIDFRHAGELVMRARCATGRWLEEGGPRLPRPERFLSLHRHRRASAEPPAVGSRSDV